MPLVAKEQEIAMLRGEMEMLMSERDGLLKIAGAAAAFVANVDVNALPRGCWDAADLLGESLNEVSEDTLRNAVESSGTAMIVGYAETPEDAWQALQSTSADAVIVDLHLRDGTGFDLLARLRDAPGLERLVKIVLTNYAALAFRQRCMALGAQHFFDKSLEFDRVIKILDDLAKHDAAPRAS